MGEESKFFLNLGAMDMENLEGTGQAAKNLADRRFAAFEGDIQMIIEMGMFDEDNLKQVKELKRDVGENLTRYEDILTHLEALYSVKPEKYKAHTLSQEGIQPQGWALQDASNDSFVCYQDLLEYVGL